ncbi:MAG: hypothetical protein R3C14_17220 [Caldilineaceae bacterium]
MTITLDIAPEVELRVRKLAAAQGITPETYISTLVEKDVHAGDTNGHQQSANETDLLLQINQGLSQVQWSRYHELVQKRRAARLSEAEYQELIDLSDYIEVVNAERIEAVAQLAKLRGKSLRTMMAELQIKPPSYD